ncbi:hypothetical protein [Micromonospora echinofusca]|uniref:Mce-associated membrane protein n=1 Tax=Micromonospora echinofusca TaxID=47858 RepID=A0ABS3VKC1_MICEH|nr:hypothetical protein [Micromonospora echinofusca]MBO4204984.1 hypothetical protein [Micromonospora echinofusca]
MQPPAGSQVSRVPAQRTPPEQYAPTPVTPPTPPKPRRVRRVLAVVAGVLALLCVGGTAVGYVLYDRATAPDRSSPDVVVDNFLRAYLVDRNDTRAALFRCAEPTGLIDLQNFRNDLQEREEKFKTQFRVTWGSLQVLKHGKAAEVKVHLQISTLVDGISQTDRQPWRFETVLADDWRVCAGSPAG